jgi:hypothetical protein
MSNADFVATPVAGAIATVLTIAAAVPTIDERLERVRDVEQQVGRLPPLIYRCYIVPQHIYKWGLILITAIGVVMVFAFVYRLLYPSSPMHPFFEGFQAYGVPLVIAWFVLGFLMYTNFLSRLAKWFGLLVTMPPVLRTIWGTDRLDRNPDWPALNAFINGNKSAKPLIINQAAGEGFADGFIQMLDREAKPPPNRAEPPVLPPLTDRYAFRQRMSNALLAGCIIEEAHYVPNAGFPTREWGPLYRNLQELAAGTDLLMANHLKSRHIRTSFPSGCWQTSISALGHAANLGFRLRLRWFRISQ